MANGTFLFAVHEKGARPRRRVKLTPPLFMAEGKFCQGPYKVQVLRIRNHPLQNSRIEGCIFCYPQTVSIFGHACPISFFYCFFPTMILHNRSREMSVFPQPESAIIVRNMKGTAFCAAPVERRNPAVNDMPFFGGIEAGGTKIVCASGTGPEDIHRAEFPSGDVPETVLPSVIGWLRGEEHRRGPFRALGIGSFGPVDLSPLSPSYGRITTTPKEGWRYTDILGAFRRAFPGIPIGFDTDVNAAALGERRWGAARGLDDFVYITMGTGIGAGAMAGGSPLHGLVHPEAGHIRIPKLPGDAFPGICPFHGDCWEGLCSGPAIRKRTGIPAEDLPGDHEAWILTARYTALAVANLVCTLSPRRVILGGSVPRAGLLGRERFLAMVRGGVREALGGYISAPELSGDLSGYILPPLLEENAGICGALVLAREAWDKDRRHETASREDISSR